MNFQMFRLTCRFCGWTCAITGEVDASYATNIYTSHLVDHVEAWVADFYGGSFS